MRDPVAFSVTPVVKGEKHRGKLRPGKAVAPLSLRSRSAPRQSAPGFARLRARALGAEVAEPGVAAAAAEMRPRPGHRAAPPREPPARGSPG